MTVTKTNRALAPILLIEDEPSVSAFVRTALERRGYRVVQAATGAEGLRELSGGNFSGVISDIRMPGDINGRSWASASF
jgi:DNA-binding response OmpR family regulator